MVYSQRSIFKRLLSLCDCILPMPLFVVAPPVVAAPVVAAVVVAASVVDAPVVAG